MPEPLSNSRREIFCQLIAAGTLAGEAYIRAGYKLSDMSAANKAGQTLRNEPEVAQRISELMSAAAKKAELKAADIINELRRIAFLDIRKAVRWVDAQTEVYTANPDDLEPEALAELEEQVKRGEVELTEEGYFRKTVVIQPGVWLINSEELDPDTAAAIAEVQQTAHGIKLKFHPKMPALELLGKYLQLWTDDRTAAEVPFAVIDKPESPEEWLDKHGAKPDKTQH